VQLCGGFEPSMSANAGRLYRREDTTHKGKRWIVCQTDKVGRRVARSQEFVIMH